MVFMLHLPGYILELCKTMAENGKCYLVGGSVRDLLLGKRVSDYDFIFTGKREALLKKFQKFYIPSQKSEETVVILYRGKEFEINLTTNLEENLEKRDFTINAMAYDPFREELIDLHNGREDLRAKLIRATVDPHARFREDPLRIIRGVRLKQKLHFNIEEETYMAMRWNAYLLYSVNPLRLKKEIENILSLPRPSKVFKELAEIKALHYILPELASCIDVTQNRFHKYDVFIHTLKVLDNTPSSNLPVRYAALFHDIGKPATKKWNEDKKDFTFYNHEKLGTAIAEEVLKRLGVDKNIRKKVTSLVANHMFSYHQRWSDRAVRRFIFRVGEENIDDLFLLRRADRIGTGMKKGFEDLEELKSRIDEEIKKATIPDVNSIAINGYDLINLGLKGKEIGDTKKYLLEKIMENPSLNEKEKLLKIIREEFIPSLKQRKNQNNSQET